MTVTKPRLAIGMWGISSIIWLTLCVGIPAATLGVRTSAIDDDVPLFAITLILIVYSGSRLTALVLFGQLRILAGAFWLLSYMSLGLAPLAQITTGQSSYMADPSTRFEASVIIIIGLIAYDYGSYRAAQRLSSAPRVNADKINGVRRDRLTALSVFAVLASGYYVHLLGVSTFFLSRQESSEAIASAGLGQGSQANSAFVVAFGTVPALIALISWAVIYRRGTPRQLGAMLWIIVLVAVNIVVNNPISNSRYWFLTVCAGLLFSMPRMSPTKYRAILVIGLVAAALIFPYSDYFRLNAEARSGPAKQSPLVTMATKDYDQLTQVGNGVWYAETQDGHTFGRQALGDVLFWLPRSVWPSKPIDTGVMIGKAMHYPNVNLSSPLWIEAWIDFGVPGVVVVFGIFGYWSRRLDQTFQALHDPKRPRALLLDVGLPILAGYEFIILRGALLQAMGRIVVVAALLYLLSDRTSPSSGSGARTEELRIYLPERESALAPDASVAASAAVSGTAARSEL